MKKELQNNSQVDMDRIFQLLRQGAELALTFITGDEVLEEMEQATMAGSGETSGHDDPVLMASTRRAIRSSVIHWLSSTIEMPSRKVEPYISENVIENAISMMELGIPELMISIGRSAQNIAWQHWMDVAFEISESPQELKQLLDFSFHSISRYIEESEALLQEKLKEYSEKYLSKYSAEKRNLVTKILEGNASNVDQLAWRLDYSMSVEHYAAIVWSEEGNAELSLLEEAAEFFIKGCGQGRSLTVIMSANVLWVWTPVIHELDERLLSQFMMKLPGIRMTYAIGEKGVEGFRKAHMDALSTQRVLGRLRSNAPVVSFEHIRLAKIMSRDSEATNSFISNVLGDLSDAPSELRLSLLTYIECGCNANKASDVLHTHRNTLLRRLSKAEELLPKPLTSNLVQVAAALDMMRWLG